MRLRLGLTFHHVFYAPYYVALQRGLFEAQGLEIITTVPGDGRLVLAGQASGELDVVLYWRTHVWDHAPGALLVEEAGGRVARLDGSNYEPWSDRTGLLLGADDATHRRVCDQLAPGGRL